MENPETPHLIGQSHPKTHETPGCQSEKFCVSHWFVGPTKEFVEISPRNEEATHEEKALNLFLNEHCMNLIPRFGYFLITKCHKTTI